MFSFAGDTIADLFAGTGSTAIGAIQAGRNSVSGEIDPTYAMLARKRIKCAAVDLKATELDYAAILTRMSREYTPEIRKNRRRGINAKRLI